MPACGRPGSQAARPPFRPADEGAEACGGEAGEESEDGSFLEPLAGDTSLQPLRPGGWTRYPRRPLPLCLAALLAAGSFATATANVDRLDGAIGKAVFERLWVPAPASTRHADGLGPLFLARSCAGCHAGGGPAAVAAGRGGTVTEPGLLYRLGTGDGGVDPRYGRQLQTRAAGDLAPEGRQAVRWDEAPDGRLQPHWSIADVAYGPVDDTRVSARRAPSLHGAGLLATVADDVVRANADPDDADGDGISGRASHVPGPGGVTTLGRFGWKAVEPDMERQVQTALALDLGLSSGARLAPWGDCTDAEAGCRAAPQGAPAGQPEVADALLGPLVRYVSALPPPDHAGTAPDEGGAALFASLGCAACHKPELAGAGGPVRAYSDLLLHDLGPGLDDGLPEGDAASAEWRTAPLWTVGETLDRGGGLLHDARARTVGEAVLWHDGEAAAARAGFRRLGTVDRAALERFVRNVR